MRNVYDNYLPYKQQVCFNCFKQNRHFIEITCEHMIAPLRLSHPRSNVTNIKMKVKRIAIKLFHYSTRNKKKVLVLAVLVALVNHLLIRLCSVSVICVTVLSV